MKTLKETDVKETSMTQSLFKYNELYHCALMEIYVYYLFVYRLQEEINYVVFGTSFSFLS